MSLGQPGWQAPGPAVPSGAGRAQGSVERGSRASALACVGAQADLGRPPPTQGVTPARALVDRTVMRVPSRVRVIGSRDPSAAPDAVVKEPLPQPRRIWSQTSAASRLDKMRPTPL